MDRSWYRDKVVLITGASSGMGRAAAEQAAARGARVILVSRSEQALEELAQSLGPGPGRALVAPADVGQPSQVQAVVERALEEFGRIDVAIANAGIEYLGPTEKLPAEELAIMMSTNFYGFVHVAQAVLPVMRRQSGGTLAHVSSPLARLAFAWASGYAASKAAGDAFALGLRHELAGTGIRIVTIYPGPTATRPGRHVPADRIPYWHIPARERPVPETAARLLDAVASGRPVAVLSKPIRLLLAMQCLTPALAERVIARVGALEA
jgi:NAD(P)-dependent dehydrogenase (short-subunit alcohol dehydrogenase family)